MSQHNDESFWMDVEPVVWGRLLLEESWTAWLSLLEVQAVIEETAAKTGARNLMLRQSCKISNEYEICFKKLRQQDLMKRSKKMIYPLRIKQLWRTMGLDCPKRRRPQDPGYRSIRLTLQSPSKNAPSAISDELLFERIGRKPRDPWACFIISSLARSQATAKQQTAT